MCQLYNYDQLWCANCTIMIKCDVPVVQLWSTVMCQLYWCNLLWGNSEYRQKLIIIHIQIIKTNLLLAVLVNRKIKSDKIYGLQTLFLQHPIANFFWWNSAVLNVPSKSLDSNKQLRMILNILTLEIMISKVLIFDIINILVIFFN